MTLTFSIIGAVLVVVIVAGLIGRHFARRRRRAPVVVRLINKATDAVVDAVKRPITVAVLDEVADVLKAGQYTRNVAAALQENHRQITDMITEKIENDRRARVVGLLPFHDRMLHEVSETALRVVFAVLADPRTEELVADMLRDNLNQLTAAVKAKQTDD